MSPEDTTDLQDRKARKSVADAAAERPQARPQPPAAPAPAGQGLAPQDDGLVEVRSAQFQALQPQSAEPARENIGRLLDVVVAMTVELGGTQIPLREVLELGTGSVVKLDRILGEPVDILVNRELVARGEVVVIDERFGVRVTQLVNRDREAT